MIDMPNIFWLFNDWAIQSKESFDLDTVNLPVLMNFQVNIPQLSNINTQIKDFYFSETNQMMGNLKSVFVIMLVIQVAIQILVFFSILYLLARIIKYFQNIISLVINYSSYTILFYFYFYYCTLLNIFIF